MLPIRGKFSTGDGVGSTLVLTDRDLEILLRYMQFELKVLVVGGLDATKQSNELQDHEMAGLLFFNIKASLLMCIMTKRITRFLFLRNFFFRE